MTTAMGALLVLWALVILLLDAPLLGIYDPRPAPERAVAEATGEGETDPRTNVDRLSSASAEAARRYGDVLAIARRRRGITLATAFVAGSGMLCVSRWIPAPDKPGRTAGPSVPVGRDE